MKLKHVAVIFYCLAAIPLIAGCRGGGQITGGFFDSTGASSEGDGDIGIIMDDPSSDEPGNLTPPADEGQDIANRGDIAQGDDDDDSTPPAGDDDTGDQGDDDDDNIGEPVRAIKSITLLNNNNMLMNEITFSYDENSHTLSEAEAKPYLPHPYDKYESYRMKYHWNEQGIDEVAILLKKQGTQDEMKFRFRLNRDSDGTLESSRLDFFPDDIQPPIWIPVASTTYTWSTDRSVRSDVTAFFMQGSTIFETPADTTRITDTVTFGDGEQPQQRCRCHFTDTGNQCQWTSYAYDSDGRLDKFSTYRTTKCTEQDQLIRKLDIVGNTQDDLVASILLSTFDETQQDIISFKGDLVHDTATSKMLILQPPNPDALLDIDYAFELLPEPPRMPPIDLLPDMLIHQYLNSAVAVTDLWLFQSLAIMNYSAVFRDGRGLVIQ